MIRSAFGLQLELVGGTPEQVATLVRATRERWQPVITKAKIVE